MDVVGVEIELEVELRVLVLVPALGLSVAVDTALGGVVTTVLDFELVTALGGGCHTYKQLVFVLLEIVNGLVVAVSF